MVHPYMRSSKNLSTSETVNTASEKVIGMLSRLHVLVIGPGLGRDFAMQETCAQVINEARKQGIPFVLDADGLLLAQERPELVKGYKECILTPNVVEFGRLCKARGVKTGGEGQPSEDDLASQCEALARAYDGVTIIAKGKSDYVSDGKITLVSDGEGGRKRSGGQGDTLTGSLATMLAWRKAYLDKLWEHDNDMSAPELLALAAFGGSVVTRECSRLAFEEKGRSMQASDLTDKVHEAFLNTIGEPTSRL
jgi:ATP-dependent NAD(P)H-hydrate dehydratase